MDIIPVFLGADLNCYNMARAFHEQYGVESYAFGKYAVGATKYSKIVHFTIVEHLDNDSVMIHTVNTFARAHSGKQLVLLGCTDDYAAMIIKNKPLLSDAYLAPCPTPDLYERLSRKSDFYDICRKYSIPFPKTKILEKNWDKAAITPEILHFPYPIIIKASSSVAYWKHPFEGMKKVYIAQDQTEAADILAEIFASGYDDKIILQEFIAGDDSHMRVLTAYSDRNGKVKMMCLGHVLLEEHTPKGLGNHAAIVTETNPALYQQFQKMLEDLGYTGFSNFDLKYDARDGSYRTFEINLRQGRSNYYVTAAGLNLAKFIMDDGTIDSPAVFCENEHYWHAVPTGIVYKYVRDETIKQKVHALIRAKKETASFWYKPDLTLNPLRQIFVAEHLRRQYKKFKIHYPVEKS